MTRDPDPMEEVRATDRLAALACHDILDTPAEKGFDDIVLLARTVCAAPVALVSLVAGDRQWFKARSGFPYDQTDLDASICVHTLGRRDLLVIPDLTRDERTRTNPLVTGDPRIRFYAGAPLVTPQGHALGSLCVIDTVARPEGLTGEQAECLRALAGQVMAQIAHRARDRWPDEPVLHRPGVAGRSGAGCDPGSPDLPAPVRHGPSEADFRNLADTLPQLAWIADGDGNIFWYNRRWYEFTGTTLDAMKGWGWKAVHHPDHVDRVVARISDAFGAGEPWNDTFPLRSAQGEYRWFLSRANPFRDEQGHIVRWYGTNTDITERKRMEGRLARHAVDLRRTNEELEQFAYVASHDLKAPLRGIENLVSWIEEDLEGSLDGDVKTNMDLLKSRVRRLESLLDDLLAYSRAGRADVAFSEVDTRALVEELTALVSPPEGFSIAASDDLPTLKAAKAPLTQALQNLIGNAIKHHDRPAGGHVWVDALPAADMVEFVVTDDGAGIPQEFRERVFGMFQTLKPRDEVEGSGMGLAIVRKLVERQGGKVWLTEGRKGRGLSVHFTWPKDGAKGSSDGFDG